MKLYFIRHAKASYLAESDEMRPLYPEGLVQAQNVGKVLKALDVKPLKIYSSPRLRALQTAEELGKILGVKADIKEDCNFDFSLRKALSLIEGMDDEAEVFFVGHNPSMSEVVAETTGAQLDLNPAAVACVTHFNPQAPTHGILKWLLTPKLAAAILDAK